MEDEKEIIRMLAAQVKIWIYSCVEDADKYTKDMNEDYLHFFCWYSEDMYKVQLKLKIYRNLQETINSEKLSDVLEHLRHTVEHFTDDLMLGPIQHHYTNASPNTAHLLALEVKQNVVQEFRQMLRRVEKEQGKKIAG